jgi:NTP pyrophosphatase (non-canonical NTP hydrolase)
LRAFATEREWEQFHDPKNLVMALASEAGELLAEHRWVSNAEADAYSRVHPQRERITQEVADVGVTLLLLCDRVGIDLVGAMRAKIAVNRQNYPIERSRGKAGRPE